MQKSVPLRQRRRRHSDKIRTGAATQDQPLGLRFGRLHMSNSELSLLKCPSLQFLRRRAAQLLPILTLRLFAYLEIVPVSSVELIVLPGGRSPLQEQAVPLSGP